MPSPFGRFSPLLICALAVAPACAALLWAAPCAASGALAVGVPANVAKDGFAYGYTNDKTTAKIARDGAMHSCSTTKAGSQAARRLCTIVRTYHDECVAVAMDPVAGTPGVGWAIAATSHEAEAQALANCEATAGPGRRAACRIDHWNCDGTAK
jgi:Domain of unknown function (DUF4189)